MRKVISLALLLCSIFTTLWAQSHAYKVEEIPMVHLQNRTRYVSNPDGILSAGAVLEDRMTSKVGLLSGGQRQAITLLMAALKQPKLLLLDEHTAALDPKTAAKVLEISDKIIAENQLTAMMVTHNMKDAIVHGNRLIMMHEGKVIYDVAGEEKKNLQVKDLLAKFEEVSGGEFANDRMMLA